MATQSPSRLKRTVREKMKQILSLGGPVHATMERVKRALLSIQRDAKAHASAPSMASVELSRRDLSVVDFGIGDFYSVCLTTKPSAEVVIGIVDPTRQVSCFPAVLSFTAVNFGVPQFVRVVCTDSSVFEENFSFLEHTVTSMDKRYHKATVPTVVVHLFSVSSAFAWGFGDGHHGQLGMEGPFPTKEPQQIHISYTHSAAATAATAHPHSRAASGGVQRAGTSSAALLSPTSAAGPAPETLDLAAAKSRTDISSLGCGERHSAFVTAEGECWSASSRFLLVRRQCAHNLAPFHRATVHVRRSGGTRPAASIVSRHA